VDLVEFEREAFGKGMDVASQLWTSVVRVLLESPWWLVQLKDARNSPAKMAELRHRAMTINLCDLDRGFGYEFVKAARKEPDNPACLERVADELLGAMAKHCPATNFSLERLLVVDRVAHYIY